MTVKCTYIFYERYEPIIQRAFLLVKDMLVEDIESIRHHQEHGIPMDDALIAIDRYHYLIHYLSIVRNRIEQYFLASGEECLPDEVLETFKERYLISCLVKSNICHRHTKAIVDMFFDELPLCSVPISYGWGDVTDCVKQGDDIYAMSTVLLKKRNGYVLASYTVPVDATIADIQAIVGDLDVATHLYNERFSIVNDPGYCCLEPPLSPITVNAYVTSSSSILVVWFGDASLYEVTLSQGSTTISHTEETGTSKSYTGLTHGATYTVSVKAKNCAGVVQGATSVTVQPYQITLSLSTKAQNHLTIDVPPVVHKYYGESYTMTYSDNAFPYYMLSVLSVNGEDHLSEAVYTDYYAGLPIAGYYAISFVLGNYNIFLDVVITVPCDAYQLTYTTNTLEIINIDT